MDLILASGNPHKAEEFNELFDSSTINVSAASEKIDVVEDGSTFQENAFKKAEAYYKKFKVPTLSDDSGLCLPAREDILGIHSARYADHLSSYQEKNDHLLDEISDLSGEKRKAYFACYICLYINPSQVYFFEGRVHGVIGDKQQGSDGFGYDPIFLPDGQNGKSLAELPEWKNIHSHRAKAAKACQEFVAGYKNAQTNLLKYSK